MIKNPVQQQGSVTPGHLAQWVTDSVIKDSGVIPTSQTIPASNSQITATGTTTARTLANRFADPINALDFGADPTAGSDSTVAIQNAINAAAAKNGGLIWLPAGNYIISATLAVTTSDLFIEGEGAPWLNGTQVTTANATGTNLIWAGSGGIMMEYKSLAAGNNANVGGGISRIGFLSDNSSGLSGNQAAIGLFIEGWRYGEFCDLYFQEFTTAGLQLAQPSSTNGVQFCNFYTITGLQKNNSGAFILVSGGGSANASLNYINNIDAITNTGDGLVFQSTDNDYASNIRIFCVTPATGRGVVFHADNSFASNSNIVEHLSTNCAVSVYAEGTENGKTIASFDNWATFIDSGNNTANPTIGTGASLFWSNTRQGQSALTWSPTLTPNGGSITYAVRQAIYQLVGQWVMFSALFSITVDNGTGFLAMTLPILPDNSVGLGSGNSVGTAYASSLAKMGSVQVKTGSVSANIYRYDGAYPTIGGGGADFLTVSGFYLQQRPSGS